MFSPASLSIGQLQKALACGDWLSSSLTSSSQASSYRSKFWIWIKKCLGFAKEFRIQQLTRAILNKMAQEACPAHFQTLTALYQTLLKKLSKKQHAHLKIELVQHFSKLANTVQATCGFLQMLVDTAPSDLNFDSMAKRYEALLAANQSYPQAKAALSNAFIYWQAPFQATHTFLQDLAAQRPSFSNVAAITADCERLLNQPAPPALKKTLSKALASWLAPFLSTREAFQAHPQLVTIYQRQLALELVQQKGQLAHYLDDSLKKDRELAVAAVRNEGEALECFDEVYKDDEEIAMIAVTQNGWLLCCLSTRLKDMEAIVETAVLQNPDSALFASERLKSRYVQTQAWPRTPSPQAPSGFQPPEAWQA